MDNLKKSSFLYYLWKTTFYLVSTVLVIILLMIAFFNSVDPNPYKPYIQQFLTHTLGNAIELNGPIAIAWVPAPRLKLQNVHTHFTLQDADVNLTIKELMVDFHLSAYFSSIHRVNTFTAKQIVLQINNKQRALFIKNIDEFSGKDWESDCCSITMPYFLLKIANESVFGKSQILFGQKKVFIDTDVQSHFWKIEALPILFDNVEMKMRAQIDTLQVQDLQLSNAHILATLQNKLNINLESATFAGNKLNGNLIFNPKDTQIHGTFALKNSDITTNFNIQGNCVPTDKKLCQISVSTS